MEFEILVADSRNDDFIELIRLLDEDLGERYGQLQKQYDKHNQVEYLNVVVIVYQDRAPVACGAFKEFDSHSVELKRIFVRKEQRKQGLAKIIVRKLEELARESGYQYAILETGIKQHEAIGLYQNYGYEATPNYGPYVGNTNSICMKKVLY